MAISFGPSGNRSNSEVALIAITSKAFVSDAVVVVVRAGAGAGGAACAAAGWGARFTVAATTAAARETPLAGRTIIPPHGSLDTADACVGCRLSAQRERG